MPDRLQLQVLLAVGGGGFIGASLRYLLNGAFLAAAGGLPWGTLIANVSGSFALALFTGRGGRALPDPRLRGFVAAGLLSGYTTFATFANENILLLQDGQTTAVLVYLLLTNTLCLLAAAAGLMVGRRL